MATIFLIRHGENDFLGKRLAGRLSGVHLNQEGREHAQAVARVLGNLKFEAIFSSPLERTLETAQPLTDAVQLPVQVHNGLIEVDFGSWVGGTVQELISTELWKMVQQKPTQVTFPEGESFIDAQRRIVRAVEEIGATFDENANVACFSHADVIRMVLAHFLDMPLDSFQRIGLDPASISIVHVGKHMPRVITMNQMPEPKYLPDSNHRQK